MRKLLALIFALTLFAVPAMAADVAQDCADAPTAEAETADLDFFDTLNGAIQKDSCIKQGQGGDCICPAVYDPVCGCDGKTYSNSCFADCEVKSWTEGECGSTS